MSSDITIGRMGTTVDVGLSQWDIDGDTVRAAGFITNTDRTLVQIARQRLLGLVDSPDEPVVPVVLDSYDSTQSGYYRVDDASVPLDVSRYYAKAYEWSATLTRVTNFARPDIAIRSYGDVRVNVDSFTSGSTQPTIGLPGDVSTVSLSVASMAAYPTAFGNVQVVTDSTLSNARTVYKVAPSLYYVGACAVEQKIGSTWYAVTGRQVSAAATDVRVNNGLLRISGYLAGTSTDSGIQMESSYSSGASWGAVKTFNFRQSGATLVLDGPQTVQIIRNTPEEVVIQLTYPALSGTTRTILYAEVRLRRGHRMADIVLTAPVTLRHVIRSTIAMSSTTGGYQASADDANSQRHVIAVRSATTLINSNLDVSYDVTSTNPRVFGLGVRETGGATTWGTIGDTMARWMAYVGESQVVQS